MHLSYAQNLEDFHLDLIFAGQPTGTYVDVGGGHPVADNVSFWFYLKGWQGLIVEPQAALAEAYAHIRPRDRVYQGLAGAKDGSVAFHQVDGLHGLSSMDRAAAERAQQFGAGYRTIDMPVRRLDALIGEAKLTAIDFLKIDVEGAEDQVLAGLDLGHVRPKVIVVEAVNPGNLDGRAGPWEAPILAANYRFAFFDNLNRFYVAEEVAASLMPRFPQAPAGWDAVGHLWDHGRAVDTPAHADHKLARVLVHGLMATLPSLDPNFLAQLIERGLEGQKLKPGSAEAMAALIGTAENPSHAPPPKDLAALMASDHFRAALGRIACFYDGGHIVD
ncbi:MAG: FkbM family methyltransferase [Hyphomicrobiaceae bacterium]